MSARIIAMATLLAASTAGAAQAQSPTLINEFRDWGAYQLSTPNKICYIASYPQQKLPAARDHGEVVFMVSNRPAEGVKGEPMLQVGYPFKQDSTVSIDVDGKKFRMFTNNDGAWLENATQDANLVAAMRAGRTMEVSGTSSRGTNTKYVYSLSGVTAALNEIGKNCQ